MKFKEIKELPTLYAVASTGKIKNWRICVLEEDPAQLVTTWGYVDGHQQQTFKSIMGKNIGKSNETTPFEQALADAQSLWKKKKDKGYVESVDQITTYSESRMFLPMLAHKYDERGKSIVFPAYKQPKLDGVRCLARHEGTHVLLWSRGGKPITTLKEIQTALFNYLDPGEELDGEIYVHGWDFQKIVSAVKKRNDDTPELQYHFYDVPMNDDFNRRFIQRMDDPDDKELVRVETSTIEEDEVEDALNAYLALGYEGMMLRNKTGDYKYKHRSTDLQKVKKFIDAEYMVVGVVEATGKDAGTAIFVCEIDGGKQFNCRPTGTRAERAEYLQNFETKYRGKYLTVKFQDLTNDGIPRFPVGLHFRPQWDT